MRSLIVAALIVVGGGLIPAPSHANAWVHHCYLTSSSSSFKAAKCYGTGSFRVVLRCWSAVLGRGWYEYGRWTTAPFGESWALCYDGYYGNVSSWWVQK